MGKTLFDKIWDDHVVHDHGDGFAVVFVDRLLMTDLTTPQLDQLGQRKLPLKFPAYTMAVSDHTIKTLVTPAERGRSRANSWTDAMRAKAREYGFTHYDVDHPGQGISSVMAPELGLALPGMTFTVLDSHACTSGALGAAAWASSAGDVLHILATQTSILKKPPTMRILLEGVPGKGITPKDMMLHLVRQLGVGGGVGYAVELSGPVIRSMPMEGRFTVCNLTVEIGARVAIIAPDDITYDYLRSCPEAPKGAAWDKAMAHWRTVHSDPDAHFDREVSIDVSSIGPQVSWGTCPADVIGIGETIPDPAKEADAERRSQMASALEYTGLAAGGAIEGTPIDVVFIGSCANNRISDLRLAASIARGRKVAPNVTAWVVPGSQNVKRQAEAEGLDRLFLDAGFHWAEPGCSMCGGQGHGFTEILKRKTRAVSTINRNFPNRQGPGSITHLVSPPMAAAAAVTGAITGVRKL